MAALTPATTTVAGGKRWARGAAPSLAAGCGVCQLRTVADVATETDVGLECVASFAPAPAHQLSSKESPIASLFQGRVRSEVRPTGVTAMANYETFLLFNLDITVRA